MFIAGKFRFLCGPYTYLVSSPWAAGLWTFVAQDVHNLCETLCLQCGIRAQGQHKKKNHISLSIYISIHTVHIYIYTTLVYTHMAASRSFDDLAHPTIIEPGAKKYSCRSWRVLGPTRDGVHSLYPASRKRNETPPYIYIVIW